MHQQALAVFLLVGLTLTLQVVAEVPRPRGVSLAHASLYQPDRGDGKAWTCLDNSRVIRFVQINDDYCDCADGSDEPGTSACSLGHYYCANIGHRPQNIPSSRVNDGICDCCDASDEYASPSSVLCRNSCDELGRAEREQRKTEAELHKHGAAKRADMIARGKQLRAEREVRRAELDRRRAEQEVLKTEKDQLKKSAEAVEAEALELYKEQQHEQSADAEKSSDTEEAQSLQVEAAAHFTRYDTNKDGYVEVTELQVDLTFDQDRNGIVTVEEAKYFLDERERIDLDAFATLSWPRIKPHLMLAEGLFKPPVIEQDVDSDVDSAENDLPTEADDRDESHLAGSEEHHAEDFEDEEDHFDDEDTDADVGVGSVTNESSTSAPPEYDPETQHLIELANAARNAYAEVERELHDIENEIKEIDEHGARDYGPHDEWASMDGDCYTFEDREYVYTLCPFDRAAQKQRSGGSETTLGRWDQWVAVGDNKYAQQKYAHGASCWNGPQRSVVVELKCALEHKITAVSEPNRCEYHYEFETPAACGDAAAFNADNDLHDEL